jgi:hypothetical protein
MTVKGSIEEGSRQGQANLESERAPVLNNQDQELYAHNGIP